MPKINKQNILNNPNKCNYNNSFINEHFKNKVINENVIEFDDTLFILLILSFFLNIRLFRTIFERKKNTNNDKNKKMRNIRIQTDPEFLSIIVNPDNELFMLKE